MIARPIAEAFNNYNVIHFSGSVIRPYEFAIVANGSENGIRTIFIPLWECLMKQMRASLPLMERTYASAIRCWQKYTQI